MDDEIAKGPPKIQADNQSIAIGEINISGTVTGNITIGHTIVQPADARLRHELGILLKNVQTTWIQGVLEKSVHEAALLELGLELREEAVDNPWRMVIEGPDQTRETLPRGRRIKDIFDEANRLLLILGEPGSGKTTTLLQLARDLIAEVDLSTFTQPVPVILNLSTWTNKAQPLAEWLVAELNSKYRLPKKDGQRWLRERRILPLLDGLDEVRAENRAACVEKINQLVVDYGLQGMVVCSRIKDYTDLNVRLAFYRAIYLQPLTPEQVDEYLERAGDRLASLRATLQADLALRSMAQSPLILNIMSLAYQNTSAEDIRDPALATNKARRKHLLDTYITRMFNRKVGTRQYEDKQTIQRFSWLARNMQKNNQEIFLIEGLQPNWLSTSGWKWFYILVSRMVGGLGFGTFFGMAFIVGYTTGTLGIVRSDYKLFDLIIGLIAGLSVGFVDILRIEWLPNLKVMRGSRTFWGLVLNIIVVCLIVVVMDQGLVQGLVGGLLFGLVFGLRGIRQNLDTDIKTSEALRWSWRKALRGGLIGVIVGLMLVLTLAALYPLEYSLVYGVTISLLGVSFGGLSREIIKTKSSPNQGIRLSIKNAIYGGILVGLLAALVAGLTILLGIGSFVGFHNLISSRRVFLMLTVAGIFPDIQSFMQSFGLTFGLIGALWYGGLDVIQHYTLRLILFIQGHTPANYARFLDYAVDRIFLQKVGGGYRFIHRLLMEHFAEMDEVKKI